MSLMTDEKLNAYKPGVNEVWIQDPGHDCWLRFQKPCVILAAYHLSEVLPVLHQAEEAVNQDSLTAAGFVSYEAAPAFDPSMVTRSSPADFPLAWFGLFSQGEKFTSLPGNPATQANEWSPSISEATYRESVNRVRDYIAAGETYQVNLSFRLRSAERICPWDTFRLMSAGPVPGYGAYIQTGDWAVSSASPELFFQLDGNFLVSRPMKGTMERGRWLQEDREMMRSLKSSPKDRAENLMIVDMVRNDLGRIADIGSVVVERLFEIEQYPSLLQMTSSVRCKTDAGVADIFAALFPPASITGAPKIRTMQIIAELEDSPRRLYTGAIGLLEPRRRAQFNVAIRTALVKSSDGQAEYGIGGGIVWDSTADSELAECYCKAAVITKQVPEFELLESLLWAPESGCPHLERHLARLQESASYFGRELNINEIRARLESLGRHLGNKAHKIRLLIDAKGNVRVDPELLGNLPDPYRVCMARNPINSSNIFLFHKTNHREVYDLARQVYPEHDDVLLWNEKGEMTESTIANLVVELDGKLLTPPIECGLLPGVWRARMLQENAIITRIIHREDLSRCTRLFLMNAVRGMWEVKFSG